MIITQLLGNPLFQYFKKKVLNKMSTNLKVERILRLLYIPARLSFVLLLYVLSRRTSRTVCEGRNEIPTDLKKTERCAAT